ncbi:B9 domain-containing protein isoform 3 [Schistosoma japonicum]|uniref:B9 domain-containing protein 1 n=3 Tax=Schistosoma japonicum TaxID=6182 RepID=A0A4Z2D9Y2_SCHJA|nr:B9 domain-containing protein 1 [Schistosoma japonicum]TNN13239.1 B9 domain-containing protein isoform 3 [Schistosoma japonicum]
MSSDSCLVDCFLLSVTGQIEKADFPLHDYIWCKYCFTSGRDWTKIAGIDEGMTQTSIKGECNNQNNLNFPLDITWRSTNPFGWPQIVLHAYGVDVFGKDVLRGYGAVHIPVKIGSHRRRVSMFVPQSSSQLMKLNAWLTGKRPEFLNPKVIASGEGRGVTKVQTQGFVDVIFNVAVKNLQTLGYTTDKKRETLTEDLLMLINTEAI